MVLRGLPGFESGYDPLREFSELQREMNRLFNGYRGRSSEFPMVNVWANEDETVVAAEIPGVDPAELKVTATGKTLTIEGERAAPRQDEREVYHRQERGFGRFARSVRLPYDVDSDQVNAQAKHGVLTVTLPRKATSKPKRISIATQ